MDNLIYNQRDIPRDQWRYGLRSSAATGCGWIATHNALSLLGRKTDTEELIRYFEWQLPLIHGNAGTSFWGPALCFRQWGFPVEICAKPSNFDALVDRSDVCILFYHWRRGCRLGAHFIALHRTETGITGYNVYRNSTGPDRLGDDLAQFIRQRGWFGCVLLGIKNKSSAALP